MRAYLGVFTLMYVCLLSTCVSAIFVHSEFVDKAFWFSQLCDNVRGGKPSESRQRLNTGLSRNTKKEQNTNEFAASGQRHSLASISIKLSLSISIGII